MELRLDEGMLQPYMISGHVVLVMAVNVADMFICSIKSAPQHTIHNPLNLDCLHCSYSAQTQSLRERPVDPNP